jgi:hypothetical protein
MTLDASGVVSCPRHEVVGPARLVGRGTGMLRFPQTSAYGGGLECGSA